MSFHSFAAANFTTDLDRKRRPAIDRGQIARTIVLAVVFMAALVVMARQGRPAPAYAAAPRAAWSVSER